MGEGTGKQRKKRKRRGTSGASSESGRAPSLLLSTGGYGDDVLDVGALQSALVDAPRIDLASAFYDVQFLRELLEPAKLPHVRKIRLLFNGLGGARLADQRGELRRLRKLLIRRYRKFGTKVYARLVAGRGIFHTKLLVGRGGPEDVAFIGSANATQAAMTLNEEVLLRVHTGTATFVDYFQRVWSDTPTLDALDERLKTTTLVSFFRQGRLFFKPTTTLQFTHNPFKKFIDYLEGEDAVKLTTVEPPRHSDPRIGFAFNVKRALGATDSEAANDGQDDEAPRRRGEKKTLKPYSVETCLGYWVPYALSDQLNERLRRIGARERLAYEEVRDRLVRLGQEEMESRFQEYVADTTEALGAAGIQLHRYRGKFKKAFSVAEFRKFLGRLRGNLSSDPFLDRLCNPYVDSAMPEIWHDAVSFEQFRESFFGYLAYLSGRPPGAHGRVPKKILHVIGCVGEVDEDEVDEKLNAYLASTGWHPEVWLT